MSEDYTMIESRNQSSIRPVSHNQLTPGHLELISLLNPADKFTNEIENAQTEGTSVLKNTSSFKEKVAEEIAKFEAESN